MWGAPSFAFCAKGGSLELHKRRVLFLYRKSRVPPVYDD
jgi:hypothetical protein